MCPLDLSGWCIINPCAPPPLSTLASAHTVKSDMQIVLWYWLNLLVHIDPDLVPVYSGYTVAQACGVALMEHMQGSGGGWGAKLALRGRNQI